MKKCPWLLHSFTTKRTSNASALNADTAERVPLQDILEMASDAKQRRARMIGPGPMGIVSPEKALVGWIGGTEELAKVVFKAGPVGVISRSGSIHDSLGSHPRWAW